MLKLGAEWSTQFMEKAARSSFRPGTQVCARGSLRPPLLSSFRPVGRVQNENMPAVKGRAQPVLAPSAIKAEGGKYKDLPNEPVRSLSTPCSIRSSPDQNSRDIPQTLQSSKILATLLRRIESLSILLKWLASTASSFWLKGEDRFAMVLLAHKAWADLYISGYLPHAFLNSYVFLVMLVHIVLAPC